MQLHTPGAPFQKPLTPLLLKESLMASPLQCFPMFNFITLQPALKIPLLKGGAPSYAGSIADLCAVLAQKLRAFLGYESDMHADSRFCREGNSILIRCWAYTVSHR